MNWQLDALCDEFESALQRGERPSIPDLATSESAIAELAFLELHYRLVAGESVTAADYFSMYPQIRSNREAAIQLVAVEYRAAAIMDASPSEQHFRKRYPDLARYKEWSNGPWSNNIAIGTGTPGKAPKVPSERNFMTYFLANILQSPLPEHPNDLGRLGEYRIHAVLGSGGMGVVFKGSNIHSQHPAAIKVMLPEAALKGHDRFLHEARAAQKIDHPRVVPIYHVGEANGVPYIAMKLLEGQSLKDRLKSDVPLTMSEIVRISREIAEGLDAAHKLQLVHRDLKPDNIVLECSDGGEHVRILDFGLARPTFDVDIEGMESFTRSGMIAGTPAYMSPEQADGKVVDARTDLWSLGVVMYLLVSRTYPFGYEPMMKVLKAIANDSPTPLHILNPSVPVRLSNLVTMLLEKLPDNRPKSAIEVIHALDHIWDSNSDESTLAFLELPDRSGKRRARFYSFASTLMISISLIVALVVVILHYPAKTITEKSHNVYSKPPVNNGDNAAHVPTVSQPLLVNFISLHHYANKTPDRLIPEVESRGILGKQSFDVHFGDVMKIDVELSRAAYCYVVVFRPDGIVECVFPDPSDISQPPELTDRPRYPSKNRGDYYGLTDGSGFWVTGVVASPTPLPPYTEAISGKIIPKVAGGSFSANTVLWDDGVWVQMLTKTGTQRGIRGAGMQVQGSNVIVNATDWLKNLTNNKDAVCAAVSFVVQSRK